MTRSIDAPAPEHVPGIISENRGPWDADPGGPNDSGGKDDGPASGPRKSSPWLPGGGPGTGGGEPPRPGSFDAMFRRGPFSPHLPPMPGGRRLWLYVGAAIAGLWIVGTSVHRLEAKEEGVVTRLGSYSRVVGPGIQWTYPAPFEQLQKVSVREIRTETIPGSSAPNLVLTGDANIIDLDYSVSWSIARPELFLFQLEKPEDTIRAAAESAMRATIANFTLTQAIGSGRTQIGNQVQQRLQAILDRYQMGVRIENVAVLNANPPNEVKAAFDTVSAARQGAESARNNARAQAQQVLQRAQGEATAFDKVYEQYRLAPEVTRRRMYYETMERVLTRADKTVVDSRGVQPYLALPDVRRRSENPPAPPAAGATR